MIDYQVDRKMEKIKLDLTRVQMCENPLVIMMLEEKMRVDQIKANFMQEFSEKMLKMEERVKEKGGQVERSEKTVELLRECDEFEGKRWKELEEYLEILA